jgi:pimeloyl-ACP methyl ester carboxylesterase
VLAGAMAVLGLGLAVIVGIDGSPLWQLGRVTVVLLAAAALGWPLVGPASRPERGLAMLVAGVVGVVVGGGIGVPWALAGGPLVTTVAGVACLAAGLLLLVAGATLLVRALPGWWRLLAVPVAFALAQFLLLPAGAAVFATNRAPTPLGTRTPASLGMAYEDVTIGTADGVRLSGWYLPGRNRAAVVLLHGAGSNRSNTLDHGVLLARHGYGVLLLDTRGHGRSDGAAMDWGWYGEQDVSAAVSYLAFRPDVDKARIAAVGLSMGGEQALTAAARDQRIRAVVAEGVGRRVYADSAWLPHDVTGWIQRAEAAVMYPLADLLSGTRPPAPLRDAVAATAPRPVLLIAGRGEQEANRYYRDAAPESVRLWELPDTPHTRALATYPEQWRSQVTGLLDPALLS